MSTMLLLIGIGPVQDFIEHSRRMRDTWFGSHLLSEVSRAAAKKLTSLAPRWELVYPALEAGHEELEPCEGTTRNNGRTPLGISNKIVAVCAGASAADAEVAASAARLAAMDAWRSFAARAKGRASSLLAGDLRRDEQPAEVAESFLEVVAAWAPYETEDEVSQARENAEQALAARKTLRSFAQWNGASHRKSSLDGARESVLADRERRAARDERKARMLRLPAREHLDGIGFVKRAGGEPEQFIPLTRITVQPWLKAIGELTRYDRGVKVWFSGAKESCEAAVREGQLQWLRRATDWLHDGNFPYDGEVFFEGQWPAIKEEAGFDCAAAVGGWRGEGLPDPSPYVACLVADGDRMGVALGKLPSVTAHRALSRGLAEYSRGVRAIVESHDGVLVYAGGDDVLAFLPAINSVACAEALRDAFVKATRAVVGLAAPLTLSVGIAVVHTLTPLGDVVSRARAAERFAKSADGSAGDDRNALAVLVDKRSGAPVRWRMQWPPPHKEDGPLPGGRLGRLAGLVEAGRMPHKLPYELERLRAQLDEVSDNDVSLARCIRFEVLRVLARKEPSDKVGGLTPKDVDLVLPADDDVTAGNLRDVLQEWVSAAKVAFTLADAGSATRTIRDRMKRLIEEGAR